MFLETTNSIENILNKIVEEFLATIKERKTHFYIVICCLVFFVVVLIIYKKLKPVILRKREIKKLFSKLCEVNGLDKREREIIREAARFYNIENINILFLRPSLIKNYVDNTKRIDPSSNLFISLMTKLS